MLPVMATKKYTYSCVLGISVAMVILLLAKSDDFFGQQASDREDRTFHKVRKLATNSQLLSHKDVNTAPATSLLPPDVINGVEKFVFFIGYPRSGHSIVGSFLDAHPHMVIAHEFQLFKRLSKGTYLHKKDRLFSSLYNASVRDSTKGWRSDSSDTKNYTLGIQSLWQGKYDSYISVIGEKCGGKTALAYNDSPEKFKELYDVLRRTVDIPIKVFHCVRNPYDITSTNSLYVEGRKRADPRFESTFKTKMSKLEGREFQEAKFDKERALEGQVKLLETLASSVVGIAELVGAENVLELHNNDLVNDPESSLDKICSFLDIDCPPAYIKACSDKVFKSVSKSRELVVWSQRLREEMEALINKYPFFDRYSFTSK